MSTSSPPPSGGPEGQNPQAAPSNHAIALYNYTRIFSYAGAVDRLIVVTSCFAAFGSGLTMPLMYILFGKLTGEFTDFFKEGAVVTKDEFISAVNTAVLQICFVFLAKLTLTYLANLGLRLTSLKISTAIRTTYLSSLLSLPISTLDMLPPGQTAAIITTVASNLQSGIAERLAQILAHIAMIFGSLVVAVSYDWLLTTATSLGLLFVVGVYMAVLPGVNAVFKEVLEGEMRASAVAGECLGSGSVRMVRALGAEGRMGERFEAVVDAVGEKGGRMAVLVAFQGGLIYFGVYATFALAFWYAFQMYMLLEISSPEPLIVVLLSTILMASSIGQISAPLTAAYQAAEAIAIFHTIIDFPKPVHGTATDVPASGDIVLQSVNFSYPSRPEVKVLDDLNLCFPAGKLTAIVGPSGSGKSTIVSILERWYEFNGDPVTNPFVLACRNGLVTVSGRGLRDIDPKYWRSKVGLVQQENVLFNTSILQNVMYGLVGTEWEHKDDRTKTRMVEEACKDAFAHDFIMRLPEGYNTTVGERGLKLSGGERQRIVIARAIVKRPAILILDEATSAIDVRSEKIVQAALDRASKGRTTIVVAHRLATIQKADNIVVLKSGRVVQQGTHADLMGKADGVYWRLANAQQLDSHRSEPFVEDLPHKISEEGSLSSNGLNNHGRDASSHTDTDDLDEKDLLEGQVRVIGEPHHDDVRYTLVTIFSEQTHRWKLFFILFLGALLAGLATPLQAYLFATLLSLFSFWGAFLPAIVNFWVALMLLLAILVGVGHAFLGFSTTRLGFSITKRYRKEYFTNILHKPASFFDENESAVLTSRLATDPTQLQQLVCVNLTTVVTSTLNLLGCVVIALIFGWKLTLVALGTTLPVILIAMIYRMRHERDLDASTTAVFAASAQFAVEKIAAIRTAVSLTLESDICATYERLLLTHVKTSTPQARVSVFLFALSDSVPLLCMAFVLWYGGQLLGEHAYTPFQYMVVYIAVLQGGMSAGQWLSLGPSVSSAKAAAERIFAMRGDDDMADEEIFNAAGGDTGTVSVEKSATSGLEFKEVTFIYPGRSKPVLRNLNLRIEKGQFAAIVGPSGCGKSTIIALIERFYAPQAGQILLDGKDITHQTDIASYRSSLSLVAQEATLFSGTIRENILLGVSASSVSEADLYKAADSAGVHEFIISLPLGYATPLGTSGLALSGGQQQRIALARALIRRPEILLLDEATSNLDSETEARVQEALEGMEGVTRVVVAHRLATVKGADVIFVVGEEGKIVESGGHGELLGRRGVYWNMCQLQAMDSA